MNFKLARETDSWVQETLETAFYFKNFLGEGYAPRPSLCSFGVRKALCGAKIVTSGAFGNMCATLENCRKPPLRLVKWAQNSSFLTVWGTQNESDKRQHSSWLIDRGHYFGFKVF